MARAMISHDPDNPDSWGSGFTAGVIVALVLVALVYGLVRWLG
jgi:hypothetical protein